MTVKIHYFNVKNAITGNKYIIGMEIVNIISFRLSATKNSVQLTCTEFFLVYV